MSHYRYQKNNQKNQNHRSRINIDPRLFIKKALPTMEAEKYVNKYQFEDFKLNAVLENNLKRLGYQTPSPIQDQTIQAGLEGKNIVGIASTGTGKTAAFLLPILHQMSLKNNSYCLIMAPTRELAQQIQSEFRQLSSGLRLNDVLLIGGVNIMPQLRQLRQQPRMVIGTPGRIKDHLQRKSLNLRNFQLIVLDEVDRMLEMGFIEDIKLIIEQANPERQSFCFSATYNQRVKSIIESISKDSVEITINQTMPSNNVDQNVVKYVSQEEKINKLHEILIQKDVSKTIIFDDTKRNVEKLSDQLKTRGFSTNSIHGNKSQHQRQAVLQQFKDNQITVLVATDVAARGLDVKDISHVINYSLPQNFDDYIHRIGRTGRANKTGSALTFIADQSK